MIDRDPEKNFEELASDDNLNTRLLLIVDSLGKIYNPRPGLINLPPGSKATDTLKVDTAIQNKYFTPRKEDSPKKK